MTLKTFNDFISFKTKQKTVTRAFGQLVVLTVMTINISSSNRLKRSQEKGHTTDPRCVSRKMKNMINVLIVHRFAM